MCVYQTRNYILVQSYCAMATPSNDKGPPRVLILSHSFVRRVHHDLLAYFDERVAINFNLLGTAHVPKIGIPACGYGRCTKYGTRLKQKLHSELEL